MQEQVVEMIDKGIVTRDPVLKDPCGIGHRFVVRVRFVHFERAHGLFQEDLALVQQEFFIVDVDKTSVQDR